MLIGLGQVETPDDIRAAAAAGWAGDFVHTYQTDKIDVADYFIAARATGQKVSLTIPSPPNLRQLVNIVEAATDNLDVLYGYYVEGIEDKADVNKILSVCGGERTVLHDNSLPMQNGVSIHRKGKRFSRLWYPFVRKTSYGEWAKANNVTGPPMQETQVTYFRDCPETTGLPTSAYPLSHMQRFVESNRYHGQKVSVEMWLQAVGEPANDPTYKHREFNSLSHRPGYVQPRIDQMWWQLLACNAAGCEAAIYYTFSHKMSGMTPKIQRLPDIQPLLWSEMNEAIKAFKSDKVPDTWHPEETWLGIV